MSKKDTALLKSLIGYVNDVKPYHTKFREITSELYFSDKFNVTVKDSHFIEAFFQNVWDRDSIGGETLYRMSNQLESDKVLQFHLLSILDLRRSLELEAIKFRLKFWSLK